MKVGKGQRVANAVSVRRKVSILLCCLLLVSITFPGLAYARQVWSPFDHTIVALRDTYRFGGIWDQRAINWLKENQRRVASPDSWRLWWESETRAPEPHRQRMVGPDGIFTPYFYRSVVVNSITTNSFPVHRLEAAGDEISHQTRRPDLLVANRLYTAAVLMNPGNIANFAVTFESELTDWSIPGAIPDVLGWGWIPGSHHWMRP